MEKASNRPPLVFQTLIRGIPRWASASAPVGVVVDGPAPNSTRSDIFLEMSHPSKRDREDPPRHLERSPAAGVNLAGRRNTC
jgi:hypothetical protein